MGHEPALSLAGEEGLCEDPVTLTGSLYRLLRPAHVAVFLVSVRQRVLHRARIPREGPFILAVSHLSHNDPIPLAAAVPRCVDWMARKEFFVTRGGAGLMGLLGAFCVDRRGSALPALRVALRRLEAGRVVGVFPEGEVMSGADSVLNGGPLKYGAPWLARRRGVPIVPCVVLGSQVFSSITSWLPLKTGRAWIAFGQPLEPNCEVRASRAGRQALGARLAESLRELHRELIETYPIPPRYRDV